jgi:Nuclease-related domain
LRIVQLSDHPGDMLRQSQRRRASTASREQALHEREQEQHRKRVDRARQVRAEAFGQRRWLDWLRAVLAVGREQRQAPAAPALARAASNQEEIQAAGVRGEQLAADEFGRSLGDDWTLLRGYRNRRGEIDLLLLGPRGLVAIEVKYHNATVTCTGDHWRETRYDRTGVPRVTELTDGGGRSPSQQVNQSADELEGFLAARGHPAQVHRIVLFNHPRAQLGNCTSPTVAIVTSAGQVIRMLRKSKVAITEDERAQLADLIIRGHQNPRSRRPR